MSCSMSGVDCRLIRWENLLIAPTVLGDIVTVPMVPVDSVTESELSAPNQYAVVVGCVAQLNKMMALGADQKGFRGHSTHHFRR